MRGTIGIRGLYISIIARTAPEEQTKVLTPCIIYSNNQHEATKDIGAYGFMIGCGIWHWSLMLSFTRFKEETNE